MEDQGGERTALREKEFHRPAAQNRRAGRKDAFERTSGFGNQWADNPNCQRYQANYGIV